MPVSVSWMVLLILEMAEEARASITIKNFGWVFWTRLRMMSEVSMPVLAMTPGLMTDTGRIPFLTFVFKVKRCLVTIIFSAVMGPRESAVLWRLPSPRMRHSSVSFIFFFFNNF